MTGRISRAVSFLFNPPTSITLGLGVLATVKVVRQQLHAWRTDQRLAEEYLTRRRAPAIKAQPLVSVLAAVWTLDDNLDALVRSFQSIDYPRKELIVAVGGEHRLEPSTSPGVLLIEHPGGGKLAAMAACLAAAKGEIVYLTDGDCRLTTECFLGLVAPIANREQDVTSGLHAPLAEQRDDPFVVAQWARQTWADAYVYRYQSVLIGSNAAIRRSALESAGGFGFDAPIAEDGYLGRRLTEAGFQVQQVPYSIVETYYHTGMAAYLQQVSRWQRGDLLLRTANLGRGATLRRLLRTVWKDVGVLALTAVSPFGGSSLRLLLYVLLLRRWAERLRQLGFLRQIGLVRWRWSYPPYILIQVYLHCLSRLVTLYHLSSKQRRRRW